MDIFETTGLYNATGLYSSSAIFNGIMVGGGCLMFIIGTLLLFFNFRKPGLLNFVSGFVYFYFLTTLIGFLAIYFSPISKTSLTNIQSTIMSKVQILIWCALAIGLVFGILAAWKPKFGKICSALAAPIYIASIFALTRSSIAVIVVLVLVTIILLFITIKYDKVGVAINAAIIGSGSFASGFSYICEGSVMLNDINSSMARSPPHTYIVLYISSLAIRVLFTVVFTVIFVIKAKRSINTQPEEPMKEIQK